jgi:co-chaperonin GroES (HSP10)
MNDLVMPDRAILAPDGKPLGRATAPSFSDEQDVKDFIFSKIGDLDDIELFFNDVLVAKYIREKISESLIAAVETQREDQWQGVCGLVLKVGPRAFQDDEHNKFYGVSVQKGDWVLYRNSDGWDKDIAMIGEYQAVKCRVIQDAHIRARVKFPGRLI